MTQKSVAQLALIVAAYGCPLDAQEARSITPRDDIPLDAVSLRVERTPVSWMVMPDSTSHLCGAGAEVQLIPSFVSELGKSYGILHLTHLGREAYYLDGGLTIAVDGDRLEFVAVKMPIIKRVPELEVILEQVDFVLDTALFRRLGDASTIELRFSGQGQDLLCNSSPYLIAMFYRMRDGPHEVARAKLKSGE